MADAYRVQINEHSINELSFEGTHRDANRYRVPQPQK